MGSDNWKNFHKWKNYRQIINDYSIYIYPRSGFKPFKSEENINIVEGVPQLDISATFIRESLKKHSYLTSEKFIQEILWRIYWRGWLELRPQVWKNYLKNLKKLKDEFKDNRKYIQVTEGNSNIE